MSVNLLPENGKLLLYKLNFDSAKLTSEILSCCEWRNDKIKIFGKEHNQPRKVTWFSDENVQYKYSGITLRGKGWPKVLLKIKDIVEEKSQTQFNSLLINYYRNGHDYMGWHSDDESELGPNPIIASLSFGTTRDFKLRRKDDHANQFNIQLEDNDLLIMGGDIQTFWQHALPKRLKVDQHRINLTFRMVKQ